MILSLHSIHLSELLLNAVPISMVGLMSRPSVQTLLHIGTTITNSHDAHLKS